MILRNY